MLNLFTSHASHIFHWEVFKSSDAGHVRLSANRRLLKSWTGIIKSMGRTLFFNELFLRS